MKDNVCWGGRAASPGCAGQEQARWDPAPYGTALALRNGRQRRQVMDSLRETIFCRPNASVPPVAPNVLAPGRAPLVLRFIGKLRTKGLKNRVRLGNSWSVWPLTDGRSSAVENEYGLLFSGPPLSAEQFALLFSRGFRAFRRCLAVLLRVGATGSPSPRAKRIHILPCKAVQRRGVRTPSMAAVGTQIPDERVFRGVAASCREG
jgi:hypothetical protein